MITGRDNSSLGCAGLATATTTTLFKTLNALAYGIDGRSYQKAATDNIPLALKAGASAMAVMAASQVVVLFIHLDTAGTVTYSVSTVRANSTAAGYTAGGVEWPQEDKGFACIGAIKITTNASGAFTLGTTAFGAANTTVTYYNVASDYGVAIPY